MKVGRCRHGVIITVPGCQGRASTLPCCRAAVAVAGLAAATREAKEGLPPAAGEETEALRQS